ncbi:MAG: ParB N-terminal domain-containing protein [Oscillospiraceae bacterium]|nr:ParB N-terminal domain-containing protein [Oscillospiraceae bacterium]
MKGFPNHQFQLYKGKKFDEMVESIKHCGILMPIILWRKSNSVYVILSGHNRVEAAKSVGLKKGPVVIEENLTEEDAMLYVIETNRIQRGFSELSHHDRGLCLKNHYETTKSQGKRTDLIKKIETLLNSHGDGVEETSVQIGQKIDSREKIGNENGLSATAVTRYIRLATHWIALFSYVDVGNIPFMAAYNLSFIEDKLILSVLLWKLLLIARIFAKRKPITAQTETEAIRHRGRTAGIMAVIRIRLSRARLRRMTVSSTAHRPMTSTPNFN